jgi:hypothetical protein
MVALRGYVPAHWQTRFRVRRPGNQYAAEFRERRPYQGGQQVVQDLTQIIEISRTLPAWKPAGFFVSGWCTSFSIAAWAPLNPKQPYWSTNTFNPQRGR